MARLKLIYILLLIRSGYLSWQRKEREEGGPPPQTSKAFSQYSLFLKFTCYIQDTFLRTQAVGPNIFLYIYTSRLAYLAFKNQNPSNININNLLRLSLFQPFIHLYLFIPYISTQLPTYV